MAIKQPLSKGLPPIKRSAGKPTLGKKPLGTPPLGKQAISKKPPLSGKTGAKARSVPSIVKPQLTEKQKTIGEILAYLVPIVFVAGIFIVCKNSTFTPSTEESGKAASLAASATPPTDQTEKALTATNEPDASAEPKAEVKPEPLEPIQPADDNNDLPAFVWDDSKKNHLSPATASLSQSAIKDKFVAEYAADGSIDNNERVAVAPAGTDTAWWMAQFDDETSAKPISTIVIYGGGSASPEGKLIGGFEVTLITQDGTELTRQFCEAGYALEGYESWRLDQATALQSIKVSTLNPENKLVLREVQAIGER